MSYRRAVRKTIGSTVLLSSPSGGGKTHSAIILASTLAEGKPFAFASTENDKESIFADDYVFDVDAIAPPYKPSAYAEKIVAAEKAGYGVLVIDSGTHMHSSEGGLLDWHDKEVERLHSSGRGGKRDAYNYPAWARPKADLQILINAIMATRMHLIVCLRAGDKTEIVEDGKGRKEIVAKKTLSGFEGLVPICPKELPYEFMFSIVLRPDEPGVAVPIRVPYKGEAVFPLGKRIDVDTAKRLGAWGAWNKAAEPTGGFEKDDDQGPVITEKQGRQFWGAVGERAKVLEVDKAALGQTILACFELEDTRAMPAKIFDEVMDEVQRHGAQQ